MATGIGAAKVLVAEDDPLMRVLVRDVFAEAGCRVVAARDGAEALALAEREPPTLVLADLDMPRLDGLTLCRLLRAHPATRAAALVLMSGVVGDMAALPDLADAFLPKPFSLDELEAVVARVLRPA